MRLSTRELRSHGICAERNEKLEFVVREDRLHSRDELLLLGFGELRPALSEVFDCGAVALQVVLLPVQELEAARLTVPRIEDPRSSQAAPQLLEVREPLLRVPVRHVGVNAVQNDVADECHLTLTEIRRPIAVP